VSHWGLAGFKQPWTHGLSEMLYAYSSATGNNARLQVFRQYNPDITQRWARHAFWTFLHDRPIMALAGNLARKN